MRESNRDFFENIPIGAYRTTPDGRVLAANAAMVRLLGFSSFEELASRDLEDPEHFNPVYKREEFKERLEREGEIWGLEARWKRNDGLLIFVREHVRAVRDADGRIVAFEGTVEDITERKAMEAAVRHSQDRYRELYDNANDLIYTHNLNGRFTSINKATARTTGYSTEEAIDLDVVDLVAPEYRDRAQQMLAETLAGHDRIAYELEIVTKDGRRVPLEVTTRLILRDGKPIGIQGTARDIAERWRADRELAERTRLAAFGGDVGKALTCGETIEIALQRCADAMLGHLGASFASIWLFDAQDDTLNLTGAAQVGRAALPDGARVPVGKHRIGLVGLERRPHLFDLTSDSALPDDREWASKQGMVAFAGYPLIVEDRLVGVMAMFAARPLSEAVLDAMASVADEIALGIDRARATEALRQSEERFRSIVASSLDGIVTVGESGLLESSNPAATRIFGYSAAELLGRHVRTLVGEEFEQLRVSADGHIVACEGRRKDGARFPIELTVFPVDTPDGRRWVWDIRDVSERQEVDRLKKQFVATVSHELRTPLMSIQGSLSLLDDELDGDGAAEVREILAVAERNTTRLIRLINDILDLERLGTGKLEMRFDRVPLDRVVARSIEAIGDLARQSGVEIDVARSEPVEVYADEDRLVQVLVNLLANAVKFSSRGESVSVHTTDRPELGEVRVVDRGCGIAAKDLESVFEPFKQVGTAQGRGGAGLGLTVCRAIVEQHDGTIGVESEPERGSEFWFRIPKC